MSEDTRTPLERKLDRAYEAELKALTIKQRKGRALTHCPMCGHKLEPEGKDPLKGKRLMKLVRVK